MESREIFPFVVEEPRLIELVKEYWIAFIKAQGVEDEDIPNTKVENYIADSCRGLLTTIGDGACEGGYTFSHSGKLNDAFFEACMARMPVFQKHDAEASALLYKVFERSAKAEKQGLPDRIRLSITEQGDMRVTGEPRQPTRIPEQRERARVVRRFNS